MRQQNEVVEYMKNEFDLLGFTREAILPFLDFEHARPFLKDGIEEGEWAEVCKPYTREDVLDEMRDYMEFALGKARDHRGISASRSVEKMRAWLYILGDDELVEFAGEDSRHYAPYGVPILRRICEKYGFDTPEGEPWFENMSQGKACRPGCVMGC